MQEEVSNQEIVGEFNPRVVHQFDPKTKRPSSKNPFRLHVVKGVRYYEWPVNSKNLYFGNQKFAGRLEYVEKSGKVVKQINLSAAYVPYSMPLTDDQKLAHEIAETKEMNKKLLEELQAIKGEKDAVAAKPGPDMGKVNPEAKPENPQGSNKTSKKH